MASKTVIRPITLFCFVGGAGEVKIIFFCWFKLINDAFFGPQFFMCRNSPVNLGKRGKEPRSE